MRQKKNIASAKEIQIIYKVGYVQFTLEMDYWVVAG